MYFRHPLPLGCFYEKAFIIQFPSTVEISIEQWDCLACGYVYTAQTHSGLVYTVGWGVMQRYHISAEVAPGFIVWCGHNLCPHFGSRWVPTKNNSGSLYSTRSAALLLPEKSCFVPVLWSIHPQYEVSLVTFIISAQLGFSDTKIYF